MQLKDFGLISIDGRVIRPEPGNDFSAYQALMAQYLAMLRLKSELADREIAVASPATGSGEELVLEVGATPRA